MNDYLRMDALTFMWKQENTLLNRIKNSFTENRESITMGLAMMGGDYNACLTLSGTQNR